VFARLLAQAEGANALVLVAVIEGALAAYGVTERLSRARLPEGWYLGGVVVAPARRRRGIGARLTKERLDWIADRAREAYYFVNGRNRASIDLHARFGFREIVRDLRVPGITFSDGIGLLFRADLPVPAPDGAPA
jgi:GNAT superfamily N-acetyltransferase